MWRWLKTRFWPDPLYECIDCRELFTCKEGHVPVEVMGISLPPICSECHDNRFEQPLKGINLDDINAELKR
jgi:hypothetical protein